MRKSLFLKLKTEPLQFSQPWVRFSIEGSTQGAFFGPCKAPSTKAHWKGVGSGLPPNKTPLWVLKFSLAYAVKARKMESICLLEVKVSWRAYVRSVTDRDNARDARSEQSASHCWWVKGSLYGGSDKSRPDKWVRGQANF